MDIDWEDSDTSYEQAEFLYNFTASLRSYLPSEDGYLISHAPQGGAYTAQKYLMVEPTSYHYYSQALAYGDLAFGDNIDWLNVQFYNQGGGYYTDGDVTSVSSGNSWMDTQDGNWNVINDFVAIVEDDLDNDGTAYDYGGLDSSKVVVGKPISDGSTGIPTDASSMAENIVSVLYSGGTTDDTITGYGDDFGGTFLWINLASSDTVDDIESWTSTLADAMSSSTTSDVWGSSESVSNDHYHNDSLGYVYYDSDVSDWTYSYVLGWMYPVGDYDSGLWLYVNDSISWVFVSVSLGAYSYHQSTNSWYYFDTTLNAFLTVSIIE